MPRSIKDSLTPREAAFLKDGFETLSPKNIRISDAAPESSESKNGPHKKEKLRRTEARKQSPETSKPSYRVPLSTRMRAELVHQLKHAGLKRKLAAKPPDSLQAILEQAAEDWLKKHSTR